MPQHNHCHNHCICDVCSLQPGVLHVDTYTFRQKLDHQMADAAQCVSNQRLRSSLHGGLKDEPITRHQADAIQTELHDALQASMASEQLPQAQLPQASMQSCLYVLQVLQI